MVADACGCTKWVALALGVALANTAFADGQQAGGDTDQGKLDEVIVTAEKHSEAVQDVPIPVAVISAATLIDTDQLRLQDYYSQVPGLSMAPYSQSIVVLSIRGISTGQGGNPTVGIMVDDVPFGASAGSTVAPDIDPSDLKQVEVLRGPQGTLYGASSLGGLIKYVTVDPSTDALSGRLQVGSSSVYNGSDLGYALRGSVNVPLGDTFAIRASGFTREDPGYIDNPVLGVDGVNKVVGDGGRFSALWRPSELVSLKLSALIQETKADGSNDVDTSTNGYVGPALGSLQQNYIPGIGGYDAKTQAYSATLQAKLGVSDLTVLSGYNVTQNANSVDGTFAFGPVTQQYFGVSGTPVYSYDRDDKFTQEIRLATPIGQRVDWLVGAFYTHEYSPTYQTIAAENSTTGATVGWWTSNSASPTTYAEDAAFTDLTFHVTERFDIQFGGRESRITQAFSSFTTGLYTTVFLQLPSPVVLPEVGSRANAFTYLVTPRLEISPDLMVYARVASGYGAGGPNTAPGVPLQYNPDKTQNYELGAKGDFLDHRLSLDASLYYIQWQDIQLNLVDPQSEQSYISNAGAAKSDGLELSINSKPAAGLDLSAWVTWDDAVLTAGFPTASTVAGSPYGVPGDRLPYSSRFSGNLSFEEEFPLVRGATGFFGGTVSYIGDRESEFTSSPQRQLFPAYTRTDLRAGARYDAWTTNLFVTNVANVRGMLSGGLGYVPPYAFEYIRPRTVGLSFTRTF